MNKTSIIQKRHERSLIQNFLDWFNSELELNYIVVDEPDPLKVHIWIQARDKRLRSQDDHGNYGPLAAGEEREGEE